mmetsp:Transcript_25671/g.69411  ORF Transcript_25671/g.69411 Transcript_25671/m.69411 type:complete len:398 (+) Transcript_25671:429-1622(+)
MQVENSAVARGEDALVLEELHDDKLSLEAPDNGRDILGAREHEARLDVLVGDVLELHLDVLAAKGLGHILLVQTHSLHHHFVAVGQEDVLLPLHELALLHLTLHHSAHVAVLVDDGQAHGRPRLAVRGRECVEDLEEALVRVPGAERGVHALHHVGALERRHGHELYVLLHVVAALLEEGRELLHDLLVALLAPLHRGVVHLVDGHQQQTHAERLGQERVLARLPAALEARLKLTLARGDDEHANVGLAGARNHVWHVVLVTGRVEDGVALLVRVKVRTAHLHRLALGALLLVCVHDVGEEPRLAVLLLGLLLVLLHGALVHLSRGKHHLPAEGGLPRVDVSDEDAVEVLPQVRALRRLGLLGRALLGSRRRLRRLLRGLLRLLRRLHLRRVRTGFR